MKRRTFLRNSVVGVSGLAGMAYATAATADPIGASESESNQRRVSGDGIGRPVRITSLGFKIDFPSGLPIDEITEQVDKAGSAHVDIIALPELCRGQNDKSEEDLDGPTVKALAALAKKHKTYIVLPIDRRNNNLRLNSVVLLDRDGNVASVYDKIFPYWAEFDVHPAADVGQDAHVYNADFGRIGFATCFDVNFPEVWRRLADKGAEVVIWPSAYSAGVSLQAHAINHHFYIVSVTQACDCLAYDVTGEKLLYQRGDRVNVATVTLDLDRGIYHENFNLAKRDKLLKEHAGDVEQEKWMKLEQWFVLRARRPGVSARELARQYGLEELRHYLDRSRQGIDERRGWRYEARVLFPNMDVASLKALTVRAKNASHSGTTG